jgi:cobalamin biosynthesis protein CobT
MEQSMDKKSKLNPGVVRFFSILAAVAGLGLSGCGDMTDEHISNAIDHEIAMINLETAKICIRQKCSNAEMTSNVAATAQKARNKYSTLKSMGQLDLSAYKYNCSHHGEQYSTNYRNEIYNWAISEHWDLHR